MWCLELGRVDFAYKMPTLFLGFLDEKGDYILLLPSLETYHLVTGYSYEDIISQFVFHELIHKIDGRIAERKILKVVELIWSFMESG